MYLNILAYLTDYKVEVKTIVLNCSYVYLSEVKAYK